MMIFKSYLFKGKYFPTEFLTIYWKTILRFWPIVLNFYVVAQMHLPNLLAY